MSTTNWQNPEEVRGYFREYHVQNRKRRNAQAAARQKQNPQAHREANRRYEKTTRASQYRADPARYLWKVAQSRARKTGVEFTIQVGDVVVPTHCPILGNEISILTASAANGASLDRIDNTRGYVPGNVAVISRRANRMKGDLSLADLEAISSYMRARGAK